MMDGGLGFLLIVAAFILGPLLLVWSFNKVFHTRIRLSLKSWFLAFLIILFVSIVTGLLSALGQFIILW